MINEYAVSPSLFNNLKDIAFLYGAFGVDHGRFISEYPRKRKWAELARYFIKQNARDDIEQKKLIELLITLTNRSLYQRQSAPWDAEKNWIDNVIDENDRRAFRGILNHESVADRKEVLTIEDTCLAPKWNNPPSISIPRTAVKMVRAALPLIHLSGTLVLIERNFESADGRFSKVLVEFAEQILQQAHQPKITQIKYVTTYESDRFSSRTKEKFKQECMKNLPRILPLGISVKFIVKAKKLLHDRFVLTDRGCIQFGIGLDEGDGDVLITRLSDEDFRKQWESWSRNSCHEFVIDGVRT
jgi:hypothetical protein